DCPADLICVRGACTLECVTDKDCFVTWTCQASRCHPPEPPPPPDAGLDAESGAPPTDAGPDVPATSPLCYAAAVDAGDAGVLVGKVRASAAGDETQCAIRDDGSLYC